METSSAVHASRACGFAYTNRYGAESGASFARPVAIGADMKGAQLAANAPGCDHDRPAERLGDPRSFATDSGLPAVQGINGGVLRFVRQDASACTTTLAGPMWMLSIWSRGTASIAGQEPSMARSTTELEVVVT
jgi:hypothetical protein